VGSIGAEGPSPAPAGASSGVVATERGSSQSSESSGSGAAADPDERTNDEPKEVLGGYRLFRFGLVGKVGYYHGASQRNGLYDRDRMIDASVDGGDTAFGGGVYGATMDLEVVGLNLWVDFNKFFRPGGNWAVLLGFDHEFGFNSWLRLDVGGGAGFSQVWLGGRLRDLYDHPNSDRYTIGTTGLEARAMANLQFRIKGPLFTGPGAMIG